MKTIKTLPTPTIYLREKLDGLTRSVEWLERKEERGDPVVAYAQLVILEEAERFAHALRCEAEKWAEAVEQEIHEAEERKE